MKLRIEFNDMMLFYGHKGGIDVIMPFAGHRARIEQHSSGNKAELCTLVVDNKSKTRTKVMSSVVEILKDDVAIAGTIDVDRDEYLIHMEDALGDLLADPHPRPDTLTSPLPADVSARVVLGGPGRLEAFEARAPRFRKVPVAVWGFERPPAPGHNQKLTDRVLYTLEMEAGSTYKVRVKYEDGTETCFDTKDGHDFVISNHDVRGEQVQGEFHILEEFQILYDLLEWPRTGKPGRLPLPTAPTLKYPDTPQDKDSKGSPTPGVPICNSAFCGIPRR